MNATTKKSFISALVLATAIIVLGNANAAMSFSMDDSMKKCEAAFEKSQSGRMSQAEAWKARKEHKKLVGEILKNINKRNAAVSVESGEVLSNEEVLNNFKVMGRLLEMLASDHPMQTDEWGYPLE